MRLHRRIARIGACAGLIALAGCQPASSTDNSNHASAATSDIPQAMRVTPWPLPASPGAASPDLRIAPDGRLLLGWLQAGDNGTQHFRFAIADAKGAWPAQAPGDITSGSDLVANWADTPHLIATADGALWAHWLQRQGEERGGYDVVLARSDDGGRSWQATVKVNDDGTDSEHGFATLWPEGADRIGIAWLDGRNTTGAHAHHGGGRMTLRTASFDARLARHDERELDASTCDCCQTGAARVAGEPMLAWRGRDADETRDILSSRRIDGRWQPARAVHADGWRIEGCPVNGPALAAHGNNALVGWYTEADGDPRVRIALNAGRGFGPMHEVDAGAPVLGRVAVALDSKQAWIAWLREADGVQSLMLARFSPTLDHEWQRIEVAKLKARGHASGLPRLVSDGRGAWLVWTDVEAGARVLRGACIGVE